LIREIKANFNVEIILTQGPGEEARVRAIQKEADRKIHVANLLTLRQLAALLKQFTIYISNDCGPMHLSVAVGTRTLGIFGPGEPEIWFPYSAEDGHRFIHKADDCWPCHQDFCDSMACMKNIQVNDVLRLVTEMMTK
jgi:heptosyltransferase-2